MVSSYVDPAFDIFIATLGFSLLPCVQNSDYSGLVEPFDFKGSGCDGFPDWEELGIEFSYFQLLYGCGFAACEWHYDAKGPSSHELFLCIALHLGASPLFGLQTYCVVFGCRFLCSLEFSWIHEHTLVCYSCDWLVPILRFLALSVLLPLGMILLTFYSWSEMKIMIDQLKTELHTKHTHSEFQLTAKWMMR